MLNLPDPDNPTPLHRQLATIVELTEWGAHVSCEAAATGKFRALFDEMIPLQKPHSMMSIRPVTSQKTKQQQSREQGYTGEICEVCHGSRMKRNGACLLCEDCQNSSGCS